MIRNLFRKAAKPSPSPSPEAVDLRPILAAARDRKKHSDEAARFIALIRARPDLEAAE